MSAESAALLYKAARLHKRDELGDPLAGITPDEFDAIQAIVGVWERAGAAKAATRLPEAHQPGKSLLTARVALEIISHEAIVPEAYKDSRGIWTWSVGITNASGHEVYPRYKDNPQSIKRCIEVYLWLLGERYIPAVAKAFDGFALTESQFAAALSFHYNTGAILKATWVEQWKRGEHDFARASILNWNKPAEIVGRRTKERDLFFHGKWSSNGNATVYPVKKPSYTPDWGKAQLVDVRPVVEELLA